ncbi:MAG: hypothetical protein GX043_02995 [Desulfovibrionales bacterium]|nr:hypothetical protein [Desulfovibrionales bacterium]
MSKEGFSFLICPDPELIKDRLAELLVPRGFSLRIFWGDEDVDVHYWQILTVPNMMGPPNAVVLRRAQDQSGDFWQKIESLLSMDRPSIWPVFCLEGAWKAGKATPPKAITQGKYWEVAQKKGWIWEHPGLTYNTLGQEVDKFAATHHLTFAPQVRRILIESLPLSVIALRNELDKILLLLGESKVVESNHLVCLDKQQDFDVFAFLRTCQTQHGGKDVWNSMLNDLEMASGDMLFPISALLVREARILWLLAQGQDNQVQLYPRLKAEKKQLAQKLGPRRISQIWDFALQADADVKSGRLRPVQALERLVRDAQRLW